MTTNRSWCDFLIDMIFVVVMFAAFHLYYDMGKNEVIDSCYKYQRYYIEPKSDTDPLGVYINCHVTTGPQIVPNSIEGKKK